MIVNTFQTRNKMSDSDNQSTTNVPLFSGAPSINYTIGVTSGTLLVQCHECFSYKKVDGKCIYWTYNRHIALCSNCIELESPKSIRERKKEKRDDGSDSSSDDSIDINLINPLTGYSSKPKDIPQSNENPSNQMIVENEPTPVWRPIRKTKDLPVSRSKFQAQQSSDWNIFISEVHIRCSRSTLFFQDIPPNYC